MWKLKTRTVRIQRPSQAMRAARHKDVAKRSVSIREWTRCPVPEFRPPRVGADSPVLFEVSNKIARKAPSHVPAGRFFLDHGRSAAKFRQVGGRFAFHLVIRVTNGTISLPTHYRLASVPSVTRRPITVCDHRGLTPTSAKC
jgi:hypothetical protein